MIKIQFLADILHHRHQTPNHPLLAIWLEWTVIEQALRISMQLLLPFPITKITAIFSLKDKLKVSVFLSEIFVFCLEILHPE